MLSEYVQGREKEFPLIARAVKEQVKAVREKIQWMIGDSEDYNYVQMIRTPWSPGNGEEEKALTLHLLSIEHILEYGERRAEEIDVGIRFFCGGYRFFLGRDLVNDDVFVYRPLRDMRKLMDREEPGTRTMHEFNTCFSLMVCAA